MSVAHQKLTEILRAFLSGEDRSLEAAGQIEVQLDQVFGEQEPFSSLALALASYRPEGGAYLYDESDIAKLIQSALCQLDERRNSEG